jgi:rSAM/selenodomain-associated transferase 1
LSKVLGIFAKEPVAGEVKTRLCPPLTSEQACRLYRAFLEETVTVMGAGPFDLVLFYSGRESFFRGAFPGLPLAPQGEGSLGVRMSRALETLLAGAGPAALIGSDIPDLPLSLVQGAFRALDRVDVVTIPAADGGYVLVGERRHHPPLFRDIPWSSNAVLAATRRRAAEGGISYAEVGSWDDVDDLASLERLILRTPDSPTALLAARLLKGRSPGQPVFPVPLG